MLNTLDPYWIETIAPIFAIQTLTLGPFPPGTNITATISLSFVDTLFADNSPDPTFAISAFIESWTFYQPDGTIGSGGGIDFTQNELILDNCETVTFWLGAERVAAIAQINVYGRR